MMKVRNLLVTGDAFFLKRHGVLLEALAREDLEVRSLAAGDIFEGDLLRLLAKVARGNVSAPLMKIMYRLAYGKPTGSYKLNSSRKAFDLMTRDLESRIGRLSQPPDLVFHIFYTFCPSAGRLKTPYAIYFDITTALMVRAWPILAPYTSEAAKRARLDAEREAYRNAAHLFTMSEWVRSSLIEDYGAPADKVTVIGSSGDYREPFVGTRGFGSKKILFNGSDWHRKGGDIAVREFRKVRAAFPDAELVVIGSDSAPKEVGVTSRGFVASRDEIKRLFLDVDLVVAPARFDPFPTFLIEAMNYGLPCVAADRDGMPEIVTDGQTGAVRPHERMGEAMAELLGDPARMERYSAAARRKVAERFNWNVIAEKVHGVLRAL
jgi:glycosyltransferase involved in cell wall biosynthesis